MKSHGHSGGGYALHDPTAARRTAFSRHIDPHFLLLHRLDLANPMTSGRDADLIRRIENNERELLAVKAELRDLNAVKNMGRGVLWFVLKVGTVAATFLGLLWAFWVGK